MLKKDAPRAVTILACAAAFTFVAAQFPWETETDPNYDSGSASEAPSGDAYDIGSYKSSSDDGGADEADRKGSASKTKAKPKKERAATKDKPQRAANKRSSNASSPATFSGPQKTCPVCTSVRLKGSQYVDYSGGRIHLCSETCIGRVRRNPDRFADILVKRGEQVTAAE